MKDAGWGIKWRQGEFTCGLEDLKQSYICLLITQTLITLQWCLATHSMPEGNQD